MVSQSNPYADMGKVSLFYVLILYKSFPFMTLTGQGNTALADY
jgi:hypothetical protein